jgi:hypothetical protein
VRVVFIVEGQPGPVTHTVRLLLVALLMIFFGVTLGWLSYAVLQSLGA